MELKQLVPAEYPVGAEIELKTIDGMIIKGDIVEYTNDAVLIKLAGKEHIAKIHPHEIYHVMN